MPAKKKGLSFDEKKRVLRKVMSNSGEVQCLKELEALAPKHGIIWKAVKEVLESLVADGIVDSDKIGAGNFFWCLKSKLNANLDKQAADIQNRINVKTKVVEDLKTKLKDEHEIRQDCPDRIQKLEDLKELKVQDGQLDQRLAEQVRRDPAKVHLVEQEKQKLRGQLTDAEDDKEQLLIWVKREMNLNDDQMSDFCAQYGIKYE